eukprot:SAG31_NODE_893_length_11177_cov_10.241806_8_plen_93_part_00
MLLGMRCRRQPRVSAHTDYADHAFSGSSRWFWTGCRGPYSNSTLEDNAETCLPRVNDTFEYCYHICPLPDDADNAACCAALSSYEVGLGTIE